MNYLIFLITLPFYYILFYFYYIIHCRITYAATFTKILS